MRDYTFTIVPDRYFRGNGRWAKVVRINEKIEKGWLASYSVAFGNQGEQLAHTVNVYPTRKACEHLAKDWIKRNVLPRVSEVQEPCQLKSA